MKEDFKGFTHTIFSYKNEVITKQKKLCVHSGQDAQTASVQVTDVDSDMDISETESG